MSLAAKLQLKDEPMFVVNRPQDVDLDDVERTDDDSGAVLVFVTNADELDQEGELAIDAAREGRLAWIAYPKGGALGTDLNRDILWETLDGKGVRPVRQISIDGTWSALRFRRAK